MRDDPTTAYAYPSTGNHCSYCQPPAVPLLEHQGAYCLSGDYKNCPAYGQAAGQPFPLQYKVRSRSGRGPGLRLLAIAIGLALLVFTGWRVFPGYFGLSLPSAPEMAPAASLPALAVTVPASASPTRPSPTPVPATRTPARPTKPAPTAVPGQVHALEVPIEVDGRQLLIHRVMGGESFEALERAYATSSDVILALNYSLSSPLWANSLVVLAPGSTALDPALPAFQPYQVGEPEITLAELARKLEVDPSLLGRYNNCPDPCQLEAGDWLLVPRMK